VLQAIKCYEDDCVWDVAPCGIALSGFPVVFGGLVVIVLATGPKVRGFKPGQGRLIFCGRFLRRGSKAGFSMSLDLRNVEDPYSLKEIHVGQIQRAISHKVYFCFATEVSPLITDREIWCVNHK
jgi:hypothetical protein